MGEVTDPTDAELAAHQESKAPGPQPVECPSWKRWVSEPWFSPAVNLAGVVVSAVLAALTWSTLLEVQAQRQVVEDTLRLEKAADERESIPDPTIVVSTINQGEKSYVKIQVANAGGRVERSRVGWAFVIADRKGVVAPESKELGDIPTGITRRSETMIHDAELNAALREQRPGKMSAFIFLVFSYDDPGTSVRRRSEETLEVAFGWVSDRGGWYDVPDETKVKFRGLLADRGKLPLSVEMAPIR